MKYKPTIRIGGLIRLTAILWALWDPVQAGSGSVFRGKNKNSWLSFTNKAILDRVIRNSVNVFEDVKVA